MNNKFKYTLASTLFLLTVSAQAISKKETISLPGYTIETIATPNNVEFHIAGLDSDQFGNVFVATRLGDVWKYNDTNKTWVKFADGLHEPAGLLCENDGSILVTQKPELTRLIDSNNDGIADQYINISNSWSFHNNYHEFNFGPIKDKDGNYYGTLNLSHSDPDAFKLTSGMGSQGGYRGWAYKINTKGEFQPYASGLRSPAGLGQNPQGEIFFTDNQGDWVGTSKLHLLEEGKFYGHPVSLIDHPKYGPDKVKSLSASDFEKIKEEPIIWFPHNEVANSPGNPEWDRSQGKFGPFTGQAFVGDQTRSNISRVMLEKINGSYQGAVIEFAKGFQSGNIRVDFDVKGQLWVGQTARGWSAKGNKPYGLQKVTWNRGEALFELLNIRLIKNGFRMTFTDTVNTDTFNKSNIAVKEWNYLYHGKYGSPKINEKSVKIKRLVFSKDQKTLDIFLPLTSKKVIMLDLNGITSTKNQKPTFDKVYYTLNNIIK